MTLEQMKMPQLGESVTEGTISKWLVAVGDTVNKYEPIAEVMTDKVNAEIPSSFTGKIMQLVADEGETLAVGEVICVIETEALDVKESPEEMIEEAIQDVVNGEDDDVVGKPRYSPAVLKLSQQHGIDLSLVKGSGKGGRITRKDLLLLIESGNIPKAAGETPKSEKKQEQPISSPKPISEKESKIAPTIESKSAPATISQPGDLAIPVTGIRRAIANNMVKSKHEIPHAWTMVEVDVTNMVSYRDSIKDEFKKREGFNLTYFAFFIKAVAQALKEYPQINSTWAGDQIIQKKDVNISIAVATEDALYVPVIKYADEKTIKGIAREISDLADKVRTNSLKLEDTQGGTFTVNNTGSFGSVQSMGIINHPQAAILQVESIVKRPVVMQGGMIGVRDIVNLCLSLDHRVLDGLICGRFLKRVKELLENISKENTSIY